jgi:hypothetical protein
MNDELTTRLSRQLHEQADDWRDTPLTLDGVKGRARSIRRRRAATTAGVAAVAVLAITLPLSLALGRPGADRPAPVAPSPTRAVDTADPDPAGSGLGVPYLTRSTLTMPDGTEQELPGDYDSVVVLGDRVLAVRIDTDNGQATLDRIEGGEVVGSEGLAGFELASNADDTAVAYVRADGELVVDAPEGSFSLGSHPGVQPVALLGGPDCAAPDTGCVVFVNDGNGEPLVITPSGAEPLPGDPLAVQDASSAVGRVAMLMSYDELEPGSCSRVVSNNDAEGTVFETCQATLDRFSPDGTYLSAGPSYQDGIGDTHVAILDGETGKELARHEPEEGFVNTAVWEDAEHLLVVSHDWGNGEWSVVRLGVDGSNETVLGPEAGNEMKPPWRLVSGG